MKITGLSFGLFPQKPAEKRHAKIFENRNNNTDFNNYRNSIFSINKAYVVFSGEQPSIARDRKDEIIKLYTQGTPASKIAEHIGCSPTTIAKWLARWGIEKHTTGITEENKEKIIELHKQGKSVREIGEAIGCTGSAINLAVQKWNLGEKGDKVELNKEKIIALFNKGKSFAEIAKATDIPVKTVHDALHRWGLFPRPTIAQKDGDRIVELYKQGYTQKEIGNMLGYRQNVISANLKKMGYDTGIRKTRGLIDSKKDLIIEAYQNGLSQKEIAEMAGCSISGIANALSKWNIKPREERTLKFYKDEIIKAYAMGASKQEIADTLGCSQTAIYLLLKKWGIK